MIKKEIYVFTQSLGAVAGGLLLSVEKIHIF